MSAPLLEIEHLRVVLGGVPTLEDVSLSVDAGETVALLGSNGAGKTTLLRAVMGLEPAAAGHIRLEGVDIGGLPAEVRARRGLGYCPEGRRVFPGLTACENLEVAAYVGAEERRARLHRIHRLFPQLDERGSTPAWQLSGGQQQMLAIGRALMAAPRLLLLDEPSTGLAGPLAEEVMARLADVARTGTAILLAEQNVAGAMAIADRACVLSEGRIVRHATTAELRSEGGEAALVEAYLGNADED